MDTIPHWLFLLGACAIGLELGGFATVFIYRWIEEQPVLRPFRSVCPSCETSLGLRDTIPFFSYLLLGGKCRHCSAPIGAQYMLVELSCMVWALAAAHTYGLSAQWAVYLVLGVMLIAGSFIDFETRLLPDRITLGGTALAFGASFVLPTPGWEQALLGALAGGGFFWVLQQVYRIWKGETGLGTGDVKLMCMIGALVGVSGLPLTILISGVTSYIAMGVCLLRPGGKEFVKFIPYGPFLSLGCMVYLLMGKGLLKLF